MQDPSRSPERVHIEALVIDVVASAARSEAHALDASTPLLAAGVDSLTLIAALTRIELALGVSFDTGELVELMSAADLRGLAELVARKVESQQRRESR